MKHQKFCEPRSGKLLFQLLGGITFVYDLRLGHLRDRWKGIAKDSNAWATVKPKKCHLVPENGPRSLGLEKS